jgi:alpha-methylacyl-CoA racemase
MQARDWQPFSKSVSPTSGVNKMRVLDLSRLLPGPYCTRILADLGAEVIKIEQPGGGDWSRYVPPLDPESGEGRLFRALNRGKKSITLNLKAAEGREILLRLVRTADVLLETFRPGVMERLGLGYETLSGTNPRLVYCTLSGYGPTGPYRNRAGHDLNYVGLAGLLDLTGPSAGSPVIPGAPVGDLAGSLWAAVGILAALLERTSTGQGQRVDGSLLGGALSFLPLAIARQVGGRPLQRGNDDLTGGAVCYQIYQTADGLYMTLAALEPEFWSSFCRAVGREDLLKDQFAPAVPGGRTYQELCALFRGRTRQEWIEALADVDACCEPVYTLSEALASEVVKTSGMMTPNGLLPPIRLSADPIRLDFRAPALGEHTSALLAELGYTREQIESLSGSGVI